MTRSVARYVPSSTRIPSVGAAVCRRAAVLTTSPEAILALGHPRVEGDESLTRRDADAQVEVGLRSNPSRIARAARTARSASSSRATGAPNTATTASPMNFSTVPPKRSALRESGVIRLEHRADVFRVELLGLGGEADQIAKEHADDLPLLATVAAPPLRAPSRTRDRSGRARDSPPHSSGRAACGDSQGSGLRIDGPREAHPRSQRDPPARVGGRRVLVDPMLGDAETRPPIEDTPNQRPNPLVPLPLPAEELVRDLDAVLVTHLHEDHFDEAAERILPKDVPVFCQPEDEGRLRELGLDARPVDRALDWDVRDRADGRRARHGDDRGRAGARERLRPRRPLHRGRHDLVL